MTKITCEEENIRIDKFLINHTSYTRSKIQKKIKDGTIKINGISVKSNYHTNINDVIEVLEDNLKQDDIKAEEIELDVVYEDDDLLVVNKKSGMVVHPGAGNHSGTLVNALKNHTNSLSNNETNRPGIVHRIDKDTSGLLLISKNDESHAILAKELKDKKTVRKYIALVDGVISHETGTIDAPIGRDVKFRKKMAITANNSKPAITHFKVLKRYKDATLIECTLETGRTHQIRIHMRYIGHPVINDKVYGNRIINEKYGQLLHAKTLGFTHPTTNQYLEFSADLPEYFEEIIKSLG